MRRVLCGAAERSLLREELAGMDGDEGEGDMGEAGRWFEIASMIEEGLLRKEEELRQLEDSIMQREAALALVLQRNNVRSKELQDAVPTATRLRDVLRALGALAHRVETARVKRNAPSAPCAPFCAAPAAEQAVPACPWHAPFDFSVPLELPKPTRAIGWHGIDASRSAAAAACVLAAAPEPPGDASALVVPDACLPRCVRRWDSLRWWRFFHDMSACTPWEDREPYEDPVALRACCRTDSVAEAAAPPPSPPASTSTPSARRRRCVFCGTAAGVPVRGELRGGWVLLFCSAGDAARGEDVLERVFSVFARGGADGPLTGSGEGCMHCRYIPPRPQGHPASITRAAASAFYNARGETGIRPVLFPQEFSWDVRALRGTWWLTLQPRLPDLRHPDPARVASPAALVVLRITAVGSRCATGALTVFLEGGAEESWGSISEDIVGEWDHWGETLSIPTHTRGGLAGARLFLKGTADGDRLCGYAGEAAAAASVPMTGRRRPTPAGVAAVRLGAGRAWDPAGLQVWLHSHTATASPGAYRHVGGWRHASAARQPLPSFPKPSPPPAPSTTSHADDPPPPPAQLYGAFGNTPMSWMPPAPGGSGTCGRCGGGTALPFCAATGESHAQQASDDAWFVLRGTLQWRDGVAGTMWLLRSGEHRYEAVGGDEADTPAVVVYREVDAGAGCVLPGAPWVAVVPHPSGDYILHAARHQGVAGRYLPEAHDASRPVAEIFVEAPPRPRRAPQVPLPANLTAKDPEASVLLQEAYDAAADGDDGSSAEGAPDGDDTTAPGYRCGGCLRRVISVQGASDPVAHCPLCGVDEGRALSTWTLTAPALGRHTTLATRRSLDGALSFVINPLDAAGEGQQRNYLSKTARVVETHQAAEICADINSCTLRLWLAADGCSPIKGMLEGADGARVDVELAPAYCSMGHGAQGAPLRPVAEPLRTEGSPVESSQRSESAGSTASWAPSRGRTASVISSEPSLPPSPTCLLNVHASEHEQVEGHNLRLPSPTNTPPEEGHRSASQAWHESCFAEKLLPLLSRIIACAKAKSIRPNAEQRTHDLIARASEAYAMIEACKGSNKMSEENEEKVILAALQLQEHLKADDSDADAAPPDPPVPPVVELPSSSSSSDSSDPASATGESHHASVSVASTADDDKPAANPQDEERTEPAVMLPRPYDADAARAADLLGTDVASRTAEEPSMDATRSKDTAGDKGDTPNPTERLKSSVTRPLRDAVHDLRRAVEQLGVRVGGQGTEGTILRSLLSNGDDASLAALLAATADPIQHDSDHHAMAALLKAADHPALLTQQEKEELAAEVLELDEEEKLARRELETLDRLGGLEELKSVSREGDIDARIAALFRGVDGDVSSDSAESSRGEDLFSGAAYPDYSADFDDLVNLLPCDDFGLGDMSLSLVLRCGDALPPPPALPLQQLPPGIDSNSSTPRSHLSRDDRNAPFPDRQQPSPPALRAPSATPWHLVSSTRDIGVADAFMALLPERT